MRDNFFNLAPNRRDHRRAEHGVADFTGLHITNAVQPRRVRCSALLLAHHVDHFYVVPCGYQPFERILDVDFVHQEIRDDDHRPGRPALQQQLVDGCAQARLAARSHRRHERFEIEVRLAAPMKRRSFELHRPAMHREGAYSHRVIVSHPDVRKRRADRQREPELVVALGQSHRGARVD